MATGRTEHRLPLKRCAISDQQKRRDVALLRQSQQRSDAHNRARLLAATAISAFPPPGGGDVVEAKLEEEECVVGSSGVTGDNEKEDLDVVRASRMRGAEVRRWFSRQIMLPEWMIDVPVGLKSDWYVFPRPAGKRCLVVSSNGTTVSRLRNGSVLHRFPSALPNGARVKEVSATSDVFCILDCIFHDPDQTYYVIDMICWRGYSLDDCSAEFRFFWLNSKLTETGACNPPSYYHKYQFSTVPVYDCDEAGIQAAYAGPLSFVRDGLLFYNKHAHYQNGNTPLAIVWKDEGCSQYVVDTDSKGEIPLHQQVVLELLEGGKVATSGDPPVTLGYLDGETMEKDNLKPGNLLRFAVGERGFDILDGSLKAADIQFISKVNRGRAFADTSSKILFQYMARRCPLRIHDLIASNSLKNEGGSDIKDFEMV